MRLKKSVYWGIAGVFLGDFENQRVDWLWHSDSFTVDSRFCKHDLHWGQGQLPVVTNKSSLFSGMGCVPCREHVENAPGVTPV